MIEFTLSPFHPLTRSPAHLPNSPRLRPHDALEHRIQLLAAAPPHEVRLDVAPRRRVGRGVAVALAQALDEHVGKLLRAAGALRRRLGAPGRPQTTPRPP